MFINRDKEIENLLVRENKKLRIENEALNSVIEENKELIDEYKDLIKELKDLKKQYHNKLKDITKLENEYKKQLDIFIDSKYKEEK